jgi:hypothetical protein
MDLVLPISVDAGMTSDIRSGTTQSSGSPSLIPRIPSLFPDGNAASGDQFRYPGLVGRGAYTEVEVGTEWSGNLPGEEPIERFSRSTLDQFSENESVVDRAEQLAVPGSNHSEASSIGLTM